jgi:hypothetical protein
LEGFVTRGGVERDRQYLDIQGARAVEAKRDVETWLGKVGATFARSAASR